LLQTVGGYRLIKFFIQFHIKYTLLLHLSLRDFAASSVMIKLWSNCDAVYPS